MLGDKQKPHTTTVTLTTANTQYQLAIPAEAQNVRLSLADATKAWRYSATAGVVAAGGSTVAAGGTVEFTGPFSACTLYVASADASQTLTVSYTQPARIG